MNIASHRLWLPLFATVLLGACGRNPSVACDEEALRRARQFMAQVLEQEANGLRLRELAAGAGRRVFYANVAAEAVEARTSDMIYVRNDFDVADANCASEVRDDQGRVVAQQINVRVEFAAGLWFDRETYGEAAGSEHIYAVRLDDKFKITGSLSPPFVSGRTAISLLGAEPYTAEPLLDLRKQLVDGPGQ